MGFLASGKELPVLSDNNSNWMIKKRKKIKFHAVITFFFLLLSSLSSCMCNCKDIPYKTSCLFNNRSQVEEET